VYMGAPPMLPDIHRGAGLVQSRELLRCMSNVSAANSAKTALPLPAERRRDRGRGARQQGFAASAGPTGGLVCFARDALRERMIRRRR
jgi:hypothetical protein